MRRSEETQKMENLNTRLTMSQIEYVDKMVKTGFFASRSEALRYCVTRQMEENNYE